MYLPIFFLRFDTAIGGFFYADKFMSLSSLLPSKNIYGLGENMHLSFRHNLDFMTWPTFGRDQPPSYGNEDGSVSCILYSASLKYTIDSCSSIFKTRNYQVKKNLTIVLVTWACLNPEYM